MTNAATAQHPDWIAKLSNSRGEQVYLSPDPKDRYDEKSPTANSVTELFALRDRLMGRYGWAYTDSGDWRRTRIAKITPLEYVGGRYFAREW